ncbi:DUF6221 family protein [Isoptericola sp. NPDC057653]
MSVWSWNLHAPPHGRGELHDDDDPCSTLRIVAQPYSAHPDYLEAWRA